MIKKFLQSMNRTNENGVTLIELIIAMGLTSMVLLLGVAILNTTVKVEKDIVNAAAVKTRAQGEVTQINRAVRTGKAVKVTSSSIEILNSKGTCTGYVVMSGHLHKRTAIPATTEWSRWRRLFPVKLSNSTTPYFALAPGAGVTYSFKAGVGTGATQFVGTVTPRTPTSITTPCW